MSKSKKKEDIFILKCPDMHARQVSLMCHGNVSVQHIKTPRNRCIHALLNFSKSSLQDILKLIPFFPSQVKKKTN